MTITSLRPRHQSTANVNERWRWSSIGMIVSRFRGILSPIFNRQRHNRSDHFSKGQGESSRSSQSQGRKVADTNTGIVLTEHTLDGTVCKSYSGLEPQISPQDSTTSNINIYAEPQAKYQDEVPAIALLSQLAGMIKKRDWNQLVAELRAHEHEELNEGVGKGLLLHLALRCDAPLHIITQLTHGIQTSASHRDARGRLPLHVAIRKVSQLSIVSHVLMLNPRACISLDDQGNTPLHICFDEDVMNAFKPSQFRELVRTLIQNSPESLTMEDKVGRCPIELAISSDAALKIILFMQLSKSNYLRQKQNNHLMGNASCLCVEKTVMFNDTSSRHVAGRVGVTMFG